MPAPPKLTRVQRKGQVTIPHEIRLRLGLHVGDLVAFIETEHGVVITPQKVVPADTVYNPNQSMQGPKHE